MTTLFNNIETFDCWVTKVIRNKEQKFQVEVKEYSTHTKNSWNSDRITIEVKPFDEDFKLSPTLRKKIIRLGLKEMFGRNATAWELDSTILTK